MFRVLLVDDQELLRDSVGYILDNDPEIEVVGYASTGEEAIRICQDIQPDVVLMDIEMPVLNGVDATRKIKESCSCKVVILTTFEEPDNVMDAFLSGADGYLLKDIKHHDLSLSIKCIGSGLTVIHDSVKQLMIERFNHLNQGRFKYGDLLTDQEIVIVKNIAMGRSNKEIGLALSYSEGTIKNKISKILAKLNMSDRMQIAIFAMENRIV